MQFTLTVDGLSASTAELFASALERSGICPLAVARNEIDDEEGLWEVVAYFVGDEEARAAAALFPRMGHVVIAPLPDTDWVRRSLEGLPPVEAGRFFVHGSHDRHLRRSGGISVEIDAGTAFGTGHHATTLGCLFALDALLKRRRPRSILDIGSGSGILALAAAKALRAPVIATDIDPEAVRVARANARLNGAHPYIRAVVASGLAHPLVRTAGSYDLIFANILARPLVNLAGPISSALARRGALILSGLTVDQSRAVAAAYLDRGLSLRRMMRRGAWSTLVLTKPNTRSMAAPGVDKHPDRIRAAG